MTEATYQQQQQPGLEGSLGWGGGIDACICTVESLCCVPETITTLLIGYLLVAQSCPTLCNPMDCSLPGSSVHGILQARILV